MKRKDKIRIWNIEERLKRAEMNAYKANNSFKYDYGDVVEVKDIDYQDEPWHAVITDRFISHKVFRSGVIMQNMYYVTPLDEDEFELHKFKEGVKTEEYNIQKLIGKFKLIRNE
jgi:hypothetical protein